MTWQRLLLVCSRLRVPAFITSRVERRAKQAERLDHWAAEFAKFTQAEADAVRYHEAPWICLSGDGTAADVDPADWDLHGDIDYPSSRDGAS